MLPHKCLELGEFSFNSHEIFILEHFPMRTLPKSLKNVLTLHTLMNKFKKFSREFRGV